MNTMKYEDVTNKMLVEYKAFISLVKRMRKAQKKVVGYTPLRIENHRADWENALDFKTYFEREVDEYLEKMEE